MRGQVSHEAQHWMKNLQTDIQGPAADKEATNIQTRTPVARDKENMSDAAQRKEQQNWTVEKPKLDNSRRLRGIYFIVPADEFKAKEMITSKSVKTSYSQSKVEQ